MTAFSTVCEDGIKLAKLYAPPPLSPELGPQTFFPSVMSHAQDILIGKPAQTMRELNQGTALHPGSYTRHAMFPLPPKDPNAGTLGNIGRFVGPTMLYLPSILAGYGAMTGPEEERGGALGEAVGSALGTAAGSPFGYLGSMVGSMVGGNVGRSIGG